MVNFVLGHSKGCVVEDVDLLFLKFLLFGQEGQVHLHVLDGFLDFRQPVQFLAD